MPGTFLVTEVREHCGEVAGDEEDTDYDQKDSSNRSDDLEVFSDGFKVFEEFVNQDSSQEKRYSKAQRIKHEQQYTFCNILRRGG